jgi:hypothetical protein
MVALCVLGNFSREVTSNSLEYPDITGNIQRQNRYLQLGYLLSLPPTLFCKEVASCLGSLSQRFERVVSGTLDNNDSKRVV